MSFPRSFVGLTAALMFAALVGCHSMSPSSTAAAAPQKAVLINSGQGTTTVYVPTSEGGVTMLAAGGKPAAHCAACEADAAGYFKTGQLAPQCAVCGATRTVLTGTN